MSRTSLYLRPNVTSAIAAVLLGMCTSCRSPQPSAEIREAKRIFELRLAHPRAAEDRDRHEHRDSAVYLARPALLSDTDIISARPSLANSGELLVHLRFTPEAGQRLARRLQDHIGGYLAVVVDGRVSTVVVIASAGGSQGGLTVNTTLTGQDAELVRELIRTKWPGS